MHDLESLLDDIKIIISEEMDSFTNEIRSIMNLPLLESKVERKVNLIKKLNESNERVLEYYESFGINFDETPLILVNQEFLKFVSNTFRSSIGIPPYTNHEQIDGLYSEGVIFVDLLHCKKSEEQKLDNTVAHEYAHKIYEHIMIKANKYAIGKINKKSEERKNQRYLPINTEESNPEELIRKVLSTKVNPKTETEKRRFEFDEYFEEMFVESLARYLTGIHRDEGWFDYSEKRKGEIFGENQEFFKRLEKTLYNQFFEELFQQGLKRTIMKMPVIYQIARHLFEIKYTEKIDSHKSIYL